MLIGIIARILKFTFAAGLVLGLLGGGLFLGLNAVSPSVSLGDVPADDAGIEDGPPAIDRASQSDRSTDGAPSSTGGDTAEDRSLENEYPVPTEYVRQRRIDETTYTWDTWTDPDDPGRSDADTARTALDSEDVEYYVFEKVNEVRTERGLEPFEYGAYLSSLGRAHSEDMYDRGYFAHENPDGERAWHRFRIDDWADACEEMSENLAKNWAARRLELSDGSGSGYLWTEEDVAAELVSQWMHSPPHREAMLAANNDVMGIGVYVADVDENDGAVIYASQELCDYPDDDGQWGNPADAPN